MLDVRADPLRKAIIVLNGEPPAVDRLQELSQQIPVYAADGGSNICLKAGVKPVWVAGDLDSAQKESLPDDWEVHSHPEQTRTDFQKVMGDLPEEVTDLLVLGGLGKRMDHQLTNLMIASAFPPHLNVVFEHGQELLHRLTPSVPFEAALETGSTLSLLPLPQAEGVSTEGLRWNLDQATLEIGGQLGQSNEVTGPVKVSISSGCLYLWRRGSTAED